MRRLATTLAAACLLAGPAVAQEATADSGWIVDVGAVGRLRPTHLGASQYIVDWAPVLQATWNDRVTLSFDDGAKWTLGTLGPVSFGPIAEYRQTYNDNLPSGAFRMHDAIEIGGFGNVRTPIGVVETRLRHAVNSYDGWSGEIAFNTGAQVTPKLELAGQLRLAWADSSFSQEFFGLRPHEAARFGLPRFLDNDYLGAGAEVDVIREITPKFHAVMALSADRMVGEIPVTPLVQTRNIFEASVGLTYHWAQGPQRRSTP